MLKNKNVFLLGEDIRDPFGGCFNVTKNLSTEFPDRVLNMPISESSFTGMAIGMAMQGFRPIVEIMFSDFLTLCVDQIINHANVFFGIGLVNVPVLIRVPTGGYRNYGATHSRCMESLFFNQDVDIFAPNNFINVSKELEKLILTIEKPALFLEHKTLYPKRVANNYYKKFNFLEINNINNTLFFKNKDGKNSLVTLIVYGGMLQVALDTLYILNEKGISANIICEYNINLKAPPTFSYSSNVFTIEENLTQFGWGQNVSKNINKKVINLGLSHLPIEFADEEKQLPNSKEIAEFILRIL